MSKSMLPGDLARVASLLYEGLGTPMNAALAAMLRSRDWDAISDVSPDPRSYLSHEWYRYAADAAGAGFLRKCASLPTTHDRRANAVAKWWDGEHKCKSTNLRLEPYLPAPLLPELAEPGVSGILREIRQVVRWLVGDHPPALAEGRFGPGATYSDRGGLTTIPDKMASDPSLTRDAIWYLPQWLSTQWGASFAQRHGELSFVPGNRFTTVPKTSKTDRAIAAEPSINVFYQLALGRQLRHRLRCRGWDLNRAQDVHRQVACTSSVSREFATLDLSNASDTVARNLVKLLLPHDWFEALDCLRSKKTLIDQKWVVLEKFSSMGNGFTFELETLIFSAISIVASRKAGYEGVLGKDVFVFGDDIIVKNGVARPLKSLLEFLGFELNAEKSYFGDEPFRESCGGDYFAGKPVRPFFLKDYPNEPQGYIALANGIKALAERVDPSGSGALRRAWFSVLDCIPSGIRRCRGPKALGDIVIHDDQERWTIRRRNNGNIRMIRVYRPHRLRLVHFDLFDPSVVLACATYGTGNRHGGVVPRDGLLSCKVGWMPYS